MSHFAQVDGNNVVIQVLKGDDSLPNEGHDWFVENHGGTWIKTSYNGSIGKNYAGQGYSYDPTRDAFIPPKRNCHVEEVLDEATCRWVCSNTEHDILP
jgi:hypothetical protein